jgi:hypothetical protein
MANRMRDVAKERFWRGVLKRFKSSGKSVRVFCQHEKLSEPSFYAWRRTLSERDGASSQRSRVKRRSPAQPPAFLPIIIKSSDGVQNNDRSTGAITLELVGGRVLRFPETIAAERLAELIAALEARVGP